MAVTILYLIYFITIFSNLVSADDSWMHHLVLSRDGDFHVYWTPTEDSISFRITAATKGYVSLGLSPHGGMANSDMVIGWVAGDGKVYFQDRYGVGNTFPPMDESQDWELIKGEENETHTSFTFSRKLQTCDPYDMEIDDSTIRLIYAYSETDPESEEAPRYHGKYRGSKSVILLQTKIQQHQSVEGIAHWDVRSPKFNLTSDRNSIYWCKIHKGPELEEKHHIIRIEPLIQPGNEAYVHHVVLYECVGGVPDDLEPYVDHPGHECYHPNMPPSMRACEGVFAAWGVGGEPMILPEHAGFPLEPKPPKYYLLEVHYDNPHYQSNIRDESGFRIYYTPILRTYDVGTFMIGAAVTPRVFIPPRQNEFTVVGHSSHECIGSAMPNDGVKMIGAFLHGHLLGRRLKARHFRDNTELTPIAEDRYYDFNYQEYHYYKEEVPLLPTDQVTLECVYNSSERTNVTFGGLSTKEEMCLVFILYYPRIERFGCMSVATLPLVAGLVGAVRLDYRSATMPSPAPTLSDLFQKLTTMDWDTVNISVVENAMRYSAHQTFCYMGDGNKGEMRQLVSYPKNLQPYEKPSMCPGAMSRQTESYRGNASSGTGCLIVVLALALVSATVPSHSIN